MRSIFILLILLTSLFAQNSLKLASGYNGGKYDKLALNIKFIIEQNSNLKIDIINTNGSVDNIKGIENKQFDLAIVQSDILFSRLKNYENLDNAPYLPICSFYQEPIYIITNKKDILNINSLEYRRINVGPIGSGLKESAEAILKATRIYSNVQVANLDVRSSIDALLSNKIDAIFLNTIPKNIEEKLKKNDLRLVPISNKTIAKLHSSFPFFEKKYYKLENYLKILTFSKNTLLIARSDINQNKLSEFIKILYKNRAKLVGEFLKDKDSLFSNNPINKWHQVTKNFADNNGIKLKYYDKIDYSIIYIIMAVFLAIILVIIITVLIIYYSNFFHRFTWSQKFIKYSNSFYTWSIKNKYKLVLFLLLLFYLMCAFLIKYYEHKWALQNSTYTIFDSYSLVDVLSWLFVFSNSGYNDDIFPVSQQAKIITSLIPFISIGSIVAMAGFYVFDKIKKYIEEASGMGVKNVKNHIIITGWNSSAKEIITSLTSPDLLTREQIVVMLPSQEDLEKFKKYQFDPLYVHYIIGKATNREDLDRANFKDAKMAIVLSLEDDSDDANSILSVLTIEKYSKELLEKSLRDVDIYTIVEIKNNTNAQLAYDADADQVVSIGGIESKIFTQCVRNPGVANFIHEIMTLNDQNDIHSLEVTENNPFIGKNFDEILHILREHKILLLAINVGYKKTREEALEIANKYNLDDPVITNPFKESECAYLVKEGDLLIVLAQYQSTIDEALKKINTF